MILFYPKATIASQRLCRSISRSAARAAPSPYAMCTHSVLILSNFCSRVFSPPFVGVTRIFQPFVGVTRRPMYVKNDVASVEQLLEYVGPCSEEVPEQPDWEHFGSQGVEALLSGLSKLAASTDFWPTPMGHPKSYAPQTATSSSSSSGIAPCKGQSSSRVAFPGPDAKSTPSKPFTADTDVRDLIDFLEEASVGEIVRRYVFWFASDMFC